MKKFKFYDKFYTYSNFSVKELNPSRVLYDKDGTHREAYYKIEKGISAFEKKEFGHAVKLFEDAAHLCSSHYTPDHLKYWKLSLQRILNALSSSDTKRQEYSSQLGEVNCLKPNIKAEIEIKNYKLE